MSACLTFIEWTGNIQVIHHTPACTCRDENESEAAA